MVLMEAKVRVIGSKQGSKLQLRSRLKAIKSDIGLPLAWVGRRRSTSWILGLGVGNLHVGPLGSLRC